MVAEAGENDKLGSGKEKRDSLKCDPKMATYIGRWLNLLVWEKS